VVLLQLSREAERNVSCIALINNKYWTCMLVLWEWECTFVRKNWRVRVANFGMLVCPLICVY